MCQLKRMPIAGAGLLFGAVDALAQSEFDNKVLQIPRTSQAPTIDGRIEGAEWHSAAIIDDLHQYDPVMAVPSDRHAVYGCAALQILSTNRSVHLGMAERAAVRPPCGLVRRPPSSRARSGLRASAARCDRSEKVPTRPKGGS